MNVFNYLKRYWRWARHLGGIFGGLYLSNWLWMHWWSCTTDVTYWETFTAMRTSQNLTKAMQFLNLTLPGNILCRDPEDQGDQQRPKRQVRPMQTSRDCWTPRWTTGDQGRPDHWDQQRPLETSGDQVRSAETIGDQGRPAQTLEYQGRPAVTPRDQVRHLETKGDQ